MVTRMVLVRSWRQIAAEVGQEDDPQKLARLTEELNRALERELQPRPADANPPTQRKAA